MAKKALKTEEETIEAGVPTVYEIGYLIPSAVQETETEAIVNAIRESISSRGGSFIAEGAPQSIKLAYTMALSEAGRNLKFDRAYFGWLKFELSPENLAFVETLLRTHKLILRSMVFKTVREETRTSVRQSLLREVKRTDTIASRKVAKKADAGRTEAVSEEQLDAAIETLVSQ